MTDQTVETEETPEQRRARVDAEYAAITTDETPEQRADRAERSYEVQGLTARLYDPSDPYNAQDARSGKGEE